MRLHITPGLSAQEIRKNQNPMLERVLSVLRSEYALVNGDTTLSVVDHGCGQLRNVSTILTIARRLYVVDTEAQLSKKHLFYEHTLSVRDFVKKKWSDEDICVLSSKEFEKGGVKADLIFSICVLDAVPPKTRTAILRAAHRNLRRDGMLAIIVPRNDAWTMRRCTDSNTYADGHIFERAKGCTFYKNWNTEALVRLINRNGFMIEKDLSVHRHACILCKKQ